MRTLSTPAAARYLTENGLRTSQSFLEHSRARGPDDPRDHGPDFARDEHGKCWYPTEALDRYIAARLSSRRFRAPAPQPANFKTDT
jgi:hypothetical protein